MPINQPVQRIIHTSDFRDKAYCFEVESVLTSQERIGVLTVSASAGYMIATSLNSEFKREQVIDHVLQEDSRWIAKATVTLIMTADSPENGAVVIRNSVAETLTLAVDVTTSLTLLQQPSLTVSESVLSFSRASPDKPSFMVLTIAQQSSTEPVTLTTDAPEYFQFASDSRPAFLPTLTLMPASLGTYVHVRYSANKAGLHSGQLIIQNSTEKRLVLLKGRSSGFLPAIRTRPLISKQVQPVRIPNQMPLTKRWVGVLSFALVSGLIYTGYINRCQLYPTLCQAPEASPSQVQTVRLLPTLAHDNTTSEKVVVHSATTERVKRREAPSPVAKLSSSSNTSPVTISEKQVIPDAVDQERRIEANVPETSSQQQSRKQRIDKAYERQPRERTTPPVSTDESELERTLNQKPNPLN
ncbi:hypothetical protein [Spirosoma validum]|uniref:Uncharacterized protein n=1 Tax=Spirosoma validum TaxID=2771355 RepID=A0A927AYT8_9BACT|nr:hypothetical protein [Spirosoma validum]MBD2752278.1 hypothetical protein [Spirosoma validum]